MPISSDASWSSADSTWRTLTLETWNAGLDSNPGVEREPAGSSGMSGGRGGQESNSNGCRVMAGFFSWYTNWTNETVSTDSVKWPKKSKPASLSGQLSLVICAFCQRKDWSWLNHHRFLTFILKITWNNWCADDKSENYIIELDTHFFFTGLLDNVTVLIGIAYEGKAIAGVINQPYYNYQVLL